MKEHYKIGLLATVVWMLCAVGAARAQTVTLTANPTSAIGSTPVTLTWSTTPTATSCTASGDWTGTKTASGTTTLTAITANKSYVLTCSFPNVVTVPLTWVPPVTNTDNSPLTNLASYKVYFGTSATTLNQSMTVPAPASGAPVLNVANGTWFFGVTAISSTGKESSKSNTATKAVPVLFAADTENVTVTPDTTPNPPANLQVVEPTAYNIRMEGHNVVLAQTIGKAKLGAACGNQCFDGYCPVARSNVKLTSAQPAGVVMVARCG